VQITLGLIHGVDYLFLHLLIGVLVFYVAILPRAGASAKNLTPGWFGISNALALGLFISSTLWLVTSSADMADSWLPQEIWRAMMHTDFGHLWCIRIVLLLVLSIAWVKIARSRLGPIKLCGLILFVSLIGSLSGHLAPSSINLPWPFLIDWLHSIAVGIWTGGLVSLFFWLGARLRAENFEVEMSHVVVERFSHFAMASTALIALTGIVMAYQLGIPFLRPWGTDYGSVLTLKVCLFLSALAAASVNQFLHLRTWRPGLEKQFTVAIRREVRLEIAMVLIIFMVVGFLARMMPPR
jgi:putative copper export protein